MSQDTQHWVVRSSQIDLVLFSIFGKVQLLGLFSASVVYENKNKNKIKNVSEGANKMIINISTEHSLSPMAKSQSFIHGSESAPLPPPPHKIIKLQHSPLSNPIRG